MKFLRLLTILLLATGLSAQVYSPKALREGQPDTTDLKIFAEHIYTAAGAHTEREKAEAVWRYFLTDGRFVPPGFWYHIAGWTYEEPAGEVLDPIKLLNSYGFGLCYHIAPLLEAVFEAGGFADARCWFLTGHTVAEVFYDGAYHYFDSDMMGYNVRGEGSFRDKPVASVHELEQDGQIILGKLQTPDQTKPGVVDSPWYPADVRARAMVDLAGLFTTAADNHLFPFTRYASGHSMDFVLRPGEKLTRFFAPEEPGLFYLPYKFDGQKWTEFPQEISDYHIRTADGPRSQKDERLWATGRIEYDLPALPAQRSIVIDMPSPYVIIDARFSMRLDLPSSKSSLRVETSTDGGSSWQLAGEAQGVRHGEWSVEPAVLAISRHGRLTAVSGSYGYKVRITTTGSLRAKMTSLHLLSRIQLNPRTLPALATGDNRFVYAAGSPVRRASIPVALAQASLHDLALADEQGQTFLHPQSGRTGEAVYVLEADNALLSGFEAGARFFDLRDGLVPDKLTAETRHTNVSGEAGAASISWSTSVDGPFHEIWCFPEKLRWLDGDPINRLLLWPEVFRQVHDLPRGTKRVYVKLKTSGPAFDGVRLAVYAPSAQPAGRLKIIQSWSEAGVPKQHVETIEAATHALAYVVKGGTQIRNQAVIFANE